MNIRARRKNWKMHDIWKQPPPEEPARVGHWMATYSGTRFWPCDPRPEEIHLTDIAHALSNLCRFGGHLRRFYSVAEHCVHICRAAPKPFKRVALLHDASEAYLVDMPRPIKMMLKEYKDIEARLEKCLAERFKLLYPYPAKIKELDNAILLTEWTMFGTTPELLNHLGNLGTPLPVKLEGWAPERAELEFLYEATQWL